MKRIFFSHQVAERDESNEKSCGTSLLTNVDGLRRWSRMSDSFWLVLDEVDPK